MKNKILAAAFVLTSIAAFAEVPDCTSSLEYIACPNSARWTERQRMPVCDLFFHDGKLWVGGGATELNAGPCPLQYIDPATKQVTVECNAGTENITVFKEFSDGRLYVPSQDPRDYDSDYSDDGFIFVRNGDNDWTFYKGCAQQQLIDSVSKGTKMGGFVHVWDAEEYGGNIFIGGYGISRTPDFGKTWVCATPSWKYGKMALHNVNGVYDFNKNVYKTPTGVTDSKPQDGYGTYRRELQFLKFKDRLFAIPYQYVPSDVPTKYYDAAIELHRYDEATGNFYEMTNRTSRVFPELSNDDFNMSLLKDRKTTIPSTHTLKLWHTTPFSNRVFYVVSPYDTYTNCWGSARKGYKETQYPYPMFACAADPSSDGMFTSERLDFGHAEEYPFDFLVKGDRMYALTVKYDSADKLEEVLQAHPEMEFVQLQINYLDWESEYLQVRKCCETANALGRRVIGVDPFKNELLRALPEEAARFLPAGDASHTRWARRFARSHAELVSEVISDPETLSEALQAAEAVSEAEAKALRATGKALMNCTRTIPCVSCSACTHTCPREIWSGEYFRLYNEYARAPGDLEKLKPFYADIARGEHGRASDCVHCGGCECVCPQHITVTKWLFRMATLFE